MVMRRTPREVIPVLMTERLTRHRRAEAKTPAEGETRLKVANSSPPASSRTQPPVVRPVPRPAKPGSASYVYRIDNQG